MLTLAAFLLFSSSSMWNNLLRAPYCGSMQNSSPCILICKPAEDLLLQQRTDTDRTRKGECPSTESTCAHCYSKLLCARKSAFMNMHLVGFVFPNVFRLTDQTVGLLETLQKFMYIPNLWQFIFHPTWTVVLIGVVCCTVLKSFRPASHKLQSFCKGEPQLSKCPLHNAPWTSLCYMLLFDDWGWKAKLTAGRVTSWDWVLGAKTQFGMLEV